MIDCDIDGKIHDDIDGNIYGERDVNLDGDFTAILTAILTVIKKVITTVITTVTMTVIMAVILSVIMQTSECQNNYCSSDTTTLPSACRVSISHCRLYTVTFCSRENPFRNTSEHEW